MMLARNRSTEPRGEGEHWFHLADGEGDPIATAAAILTTFLLIFWPYGEFAADILQLRVLGYSVFATVVPTLLVALIVWLILIRSPRNITVPLYLTLALVFVVLARRELHISEPDDDLMAEFVARRCFLLIPCFLICVPYSTGISWFRTWAPRIVVANGVITAGVGIAYSLDLTGYRVSPTGDEGGEALWALGERTRASGLFASSNVFANFLVLALALAVSRKMNPVMRWVVYAILCGGILASQSRTALLAAVVVILFMARRESRSLLKRAMTLAILIVTGIIGSALILQDSADSVRDRFQYQTLDDTSVRGAKTMLGINALFSDASTTMFGARQREIVVGPDPTQQISDNSYIAVATSVGLPFSLLLAYFLWRGAGRHVPAGKYRENSTTSFVIVIAGTALVNNSVLWDAYTFHASLIFWLLISESVRSPTVFRTMTQL